MNQVAKIDEQKAVSTNTVTPMDMLQQALERGTDMDQLTKLMDLQDRWEKNEARKAYVSAMSAFQQECPTIDKTLKAHNSTYAGLAETLEQIRGLMSTNQLSHSWVTEQKDGQISVTCCVTHVQGHKECTTMSAAADTSGSKNNIQAIGSTVKYLQRYTLFSILGLASKENDDDGKAAGLGPTITKEQVKAIQKRFEDTGMKPERFYKAFNIERVNDLPASRYHEAIGRFTEFEDAMKAQGK